MCQHPLWREDCVAGLYGRIAVKKPLLRKQNNVKRLQWAIRFTLLHSKKSRAFGADCMTRIVYIYSRLPRTHSLSHFHFQRQHTLTFSISTQRQHTLSLSLSHFHLQRQHTLSLSPFWLTETAHTLSHFHLQKQHTLSLSPFWLTETAHTLSHFHIQKQHTLSLST